MKWVTEVFRKSFVFNERSRRKEYWLFALFIFIAGTVLSIAEVALGLEITEGVGILTLIFSLLILVPSISVTIRRLHDIGRSGWWILLNFIPVIGTIIVFVMTVLDSQPSANKYGANPKLSV